jgi:hypothetical protein
VETVKTSQNRFLHIPSKFIIIIIIIASRSEVYTTPRLFSASYGAVTRFESLDGASAFLFFVVQLSAPRQMLG